MPFNTCTVLFTRYFCRQVAATLIWKEIFDMNILRRAYLLLPIFMSTVLSASDDEFSTKLRQLVDDLLGSEEFQV